MDISGLPDLSRSNNYSEKQLADPATPRSRESQGNLITDGKAASDDLRSIVASRFMGMLQAHDRARLKLLTDESRQMR